MLVRDVLEEAGRLKVRLTVQGDRLIASPGVNVTTELGAGIRANKSALLPIVGKASWPWLGQVGFVLAEANCWCGGDPYEFSVLGEPVCEHPERPLP